MIILKNKILLAFFLIFFCISCINQKVVNGQLPDAELLSTLKIGQDKKNIIEKVLGAPSFKGEFDDNSIYYYSGVYKSLAFLKPRLIDQKVLQLEFDRRDILKNVFLYGKDDATKVIMSKNETVTFGKKIGLIEQIINNIGLPGMGRSGPIIGSGRTGE